MESGGFGGAGQWVIHIRVEKREPEKLQGNGERDKGCLWSK